MKDQITITVGKGKELPTIQEMKEKGYTLVGLSEGPTAVDLHFSQFYWVFIKGDSYLILSERELGEEGRFLLEEDGFELLWDSAPSHQAAARYCEEWNQSKRIRYIPIPITLKEAASFINQHHRHHLSPQGHKFSMGLTDGRDLIGVIVAGRPISRHRDDGVTLEITRLCVKPMYKNACSQLLKAICRIAKEMGYQRVLTYTLEHEPGCSLKASGFDLIGLSKGGSWDSRKRKRIDKHPLQEKKIWQWTLTS